MKINNKGFLLMETIVTVCIIATLATSAYLYVSKTASRFEERTNYENVVDVYKTNTLKQYLEKNSLLNIGEVTNFGDLGDLDIKWAYIIMDTEDNKDELYDNLDEDDPELNALRDYLKWLSIDDNIDGDSNLRLIVWFKGKNGEDGTFANLKISIVTS